MSRVGKAIEFAINVANDDKVGYDQVHRWGPTSYDCSSLVITAYENAGIPVKKQGASYTGNMKKVFMMIGFKNIISSVNLATSKDLIPGDVLLREGQHTAMYVGANKMVQASINEKGTITGGKAGDQTGKEVSVCAYNNSKWDCVLRYPETPDVDPQATDVYVVVPGDNLTKIANKFGTNVDTLVFLNDIKNPNLINVGDKLKIKKITSSILYHTVVKGDNLYKISKKYGTTVNNIVAWNNIKNPSLINIGEVFRVR